MTIIRDECATIQTEQLTKQYRSVPALTNLDLSVPEGSVFGFLGPNGAGKTTTIRLLLGFIRPTSGRARIHGLDTWCDGVAARRNVGYLVPPEALYLDMSGTDQLDYAARLSGRPPVLRKTFLDELGLGSEALKRRLGTYSKGMRQKLALTMAAQCDPALLILDEPTDGLDPLVQRAFEGLIRERCEAGRTVFLSSHDLAEVERMCDRVAVVRSGLLVAQDSMVAFTRRRRRTVTVRFANSPPFALWELPHVTLLDRQDGLLRLAVEGDLNPLLGLLAGNVVDDLTVEPPSLEDAFMAFYDLDDETSGDPHPSRQRLGHAG
ncbi:MAG: ABC transporter ATP-binding protein [Thermomicrobiales bacterium]